MLENVDQTHLVLASGKLLLPPKKFLANKSLRFLKVHPFSTIGR